MKKRDMVTYVVLSIITFGIYFIVVSYMQLKEFEDNGISLKLPSWLVLLLLLFASGAGGGLLGFVANDAMNQMQEKNGLPKEDNLILWTVIGIFVPLVTGALLQNSINNMVDKTAQ